MGVVSLILKRISYRFEGVDTGKKKLRKRGGGGGGGGIAVNPTSTKVVFFSSFLLHLALPLMFAASY